MAYFDNNNSNIRIKIVIKYKGNSVFENKEEK